MKKSILTALILSALILFSSCDKSSPVIGDDVNINEPDHGQETVSVSDTEADESAQEPVKEDLGTEDVSDGSEVSDEQVPPTDMPVEITPANDNTDVTPPVQNVDVPDLPHANDETLRQREAFFAESAFIGDSVMHGLELYVNRENVPEIKALYLTKTSFSALHALKEVSENSHHPEYNGQKYLVEDAVAESGVKRIFISLGLNDVLSTWDNAFNYYEEMLGRIREKNPDVSIFILSPTYPVEHVKDMTDEEVIKYRDSLNVLAAHLQEYCSAGNAEYIDVISPLVSENGFLDNAFSSDDYVHLTNAAYKTWINTLDVLADRYAGPVSLDAGTEDTTITVTEES